MGKNYFCIIQILDKLHRSFWRLSDGFELLASCPFLNFQQGCVSIQTDAISVAIISPELAVDYCLNAWHIPQRLDSSTGSVDYEHQMDTPAHTQLSMCIWLGITNLIQLAKAKKKRELLEIIF